MYVPIHTPAPVPELAPLVADSATRWLTAPPRPLPARLSVHTRTLDVLSGRPATVTGTLRADGSGEVLAGRSIALQVAVGHRWATVSRTRTGVAGRFVLRYFPRRTGSAPARLAYPGGAGLGAARRALGRLDVYRTVQASWYGGAGSLACGGSLTSSTVGVASRTLPCGALITLRFGGRSIRVPVIDRGPYVAGREFDLTEATKQALGFGDTGQVWSTG
jgi:peptidoglycan lytic transglycosylase